MALSVFVFLLPAFILLFQEEEHGHEAPTGIALPAVPLRKYHM